MFSFRNSFIELIVNKHFNKMAETDYHSLDNFFTAYNSKDITSRLKMYDHLEDYLNNENTCLKCKDIGELFDTIFFTPNTRITAKQLTLVRLLIQRKTNELKNHAKKSEAHTEKY